MIATVTVIHQVVPRARGWTGDIPFTPHKDPLCKTLLSLL